MDNVEKYFSRFLKIRLVSGENKLQQFTETASVMMSVSNRYMCEPVRDVVNQGL